MRLLKPIIIALGAMLGVVMLAAAAFILFFPKDAAIAETQRRVEAATGRRLVIGGPVDMALWPTLGFSAHQASLSNPRGFSDTPFLKADRIVFAVAVLPLLSGHVEVKQLLFEGADLRLEAKADGRANWDFPTEESSRSQTIEDLKLDDVRLARSRVSFQGADAGPPLVLENVDARLALASLDQPAHLDGAFDYRGQRVSATSAVGTPRSLMNHAETPFSVNAHADALALTFNGAFNAGNGALHGRLSASGPSMRRLSAWMGSPMTPGGGFNAYSIEADATHEGERTTLSNCVLRLDAIQARGDLTVLQPASGRMRVSGHLSSSVIDLNPYLAAPAQGAGAGVQASTAWSTDRLDLSGMRALDADLQLSTPSLLFQRLNMRDVQLALRIASGAADARITHMGFYNGTGTAHLIADGSSAIPRVAVEVHANNVDALPLLRDAIGFDKIEGHGQLSAALAGQGRTQAELMHSLRGTSSFTFRDGKFKGVNLAQVSRTIQSALNGAAVGQASSTDFSEMGATFAVNNGVAATQDLHLLSPYIRMNGTGLLDIGAQTIDMRLEPRAVNNAQGQGGQANVAGLGIPFQVTGSWTHPSFRPALGDVLQNQLRDRARSVLQSQHGNPLSALGEALFGPQTTTTAPASEEASATATATTTATSTGTTTATTTSTSTSTSLLEQLFGHH